MIGLVNNVVVWGSCDEVEFTTFEYNILIRFDGGPLYLLSSSRTVVAAVVVVGEVGDKVVEIFLRKFAKGVDVVVNSLIEIVWKKWM